MLLFFYRAQGRFVVFFFNFSFVPANQNRDTLPQCLEEKKGEWEKKGKERERPGRTSQLFRCGCLVLAHFQSRFSSSSIRPLLFFFLFCPSHLHQKKRSQDTTWHTRQFIPWEQHCGWNSATHDTTVFPVFLRCCCHSRFVATKRLSRLVCLLFPSCAIDFNVWGTTCGVRFVCWNPISNWQMDVRLRKKRTNPKSTWDEMSCRVVPILIRFWYYLLVFLWDSVLRIRIFVYEYIQVYESMD